MIVAFVPSSGGVGNATLAIETAMQMTLSKKTPSRRICLLDLDLAGMRSDIRLAYRANPEVLGIFPVAAYNGGSRNVAKLYRVLTRMKVRLDELSQPGVQLAGASVTCPCVWKAEGTDVRAMALPKYNNENRWYIEKYQSIVRLFD